MHLQQNELGYALIKEKSMNCKATLKAVFISARPATLTASLAPILVAYFMAEKVTPETLVSWYLIPILLSALSIQIATNLFNDYLDFIKGGDKEDRLGPTRVTSAGLLEPHKVKAWALGFCSLAFICGIPLVIRGGELFLVLGLISIAMTYLYTGTRFSLAYTGMADLFVVGFFGCFALSGTYYLLTLQWNPWTLLVGLQLGALCNILLLVNNLRDHDQDAAHDKKTVVVRFGRGFGLFEYLVLILIAFIPILFWPFIDRPLLLFIFQSPYLFCSLYLWNWVRKNKPSAQYNKILKFSSIIYLGFSLMCCAGLRML